MTARGRLDLDGQGGDLVVDTDENGPNLGSVPTKLLVLYTGTKGSALTIKE